MYEYLIWTVLLGITWVIAFAARPELRTKMWWSSLIALPFGLGELYFIPNYWIPQTLFDLGARYHFDVEAFLLMFFLGGIAAAAYEGIIKCHIPAAQRICHPCRCYLPLTAALAAFIVLTRTFPAWNIIYPASLACLAGGIAAVLLYPGLRPHVFWGGIIFAALYGASLALIGVAFPGWIAATWNMGALSGVMLLGVPWEELLFGFNFGTLWAPLFEEVCANLQAVRKV